VRNSGMRFSGHSGCANLNMQAEDGAMLLSLLPPTRIRPNTKITLA